MLLEAKMLNNIEFLKKNVRSDISRVRKILKRHRVFEENELVLFKNIVFYYENVHDRAYGLDETHGPMQKCCILQWRRAMAQPPGGG